MDIKKLFKHALEEYTSSGKHRKYDSYDTRSKRSKYDDDDDRFYSRSRYDRRYARYGDDDRRHYTSGKQSKGASLLTDPRVQSLAATLFQAVRQMMRSKGRKY
ncbi:MAG: hypothetical protein HC828_14850 [Blastochloris sp.]|nr:hypothetical protein [Blastochloris sp.]